MRAEDVAADLNERAFALIDELRDALWLQIGDCRHFTDVEAHPGVCCLCGNDPLRCGALVGTAAQPVRDEPHNETRETMTNLRAMARGTDDNAQRIVRFGGYYEGPHDDCDAHGMHMHQDDWQAYWESLNALQRESLRFKARSEGRSISAVAIEWGAVDDRRLLPRKVEK